MKKYLIVVAGGQGLRMGNDIPKQFLLIHNQPILMYTLKRFYHFDPDLNVILGLPEDHIHTWQQLCDQYSFNIPHQIAKGGLNRFQTVKNCLAFTRPDSIIAVHDGVRPFVSDRTLTNCFSSVLKNNGVIPVISLKESIRMVVENSSKALNREHYKLVQTPQVFQGQVLIKSYENGYKEHFTDDASIVENNGYPITCVDGNIENIKITTKDDLILGEAYANHFLF